MARAGDLPVTSRNASSLSQPLARCWTMSTASPVAAAGTAQNRCLAGG